MADPLRLVWAGLVLLALTLALSGCERPTEPITFSGATMGTVWTVRVTALPAGVSGPELRAQIEALLEQVNAEMSTYRPDSVITAFNQAVAGERIDLPPGFAAVLAEALYWAEMTDGAFDPTAGPLVNLWGFGPPDRRDQMPDAADVAEARARVGWQQLGFRAGDEVLVQPGGVFLDLSAIAKGWGVDVLAEHLLDSGVPGFLVEIGGDLRTHGRRPDGGPWRVAIERPLAGTRELHDVINVHEVAITTSGDYRNFFEADGRRFSHLIDPRTGFPIDHATVSVTAAATHASTADVMATALSILAIEQAWALATEHDLAVLWLLADGDQLLERMTPAFVRLTETGAL
ncbi:MAG: FAD:protein FMN transferase [Wenzhouxiangella sp.]